jgi:hypothetical protein
VSVSIWTGADLVTPHDMTVASNYEPSGVPTVADLLLIPNDIPAGSKPQASSSHAGVIALWGPVASVHLYGTVLLLATSVLDANTVCDSVVFDFTGDDNSHAATFNGGYFAVNGTLDMSECIPGNIIDGATIAGVVGTYGSGGVGGTELFTALKSAICTIGPVMELVATDPADANTARVWSDWQRAYTTPCIVMDIDREEPQNDIAAYSNLSIDQITLTCRADTHSESDALYEAIKPLAGMSTPFHLIFDEVIHATTEKADGSTGHWYDHIVSCTLMRAEVIG